LPARVFVLGDQLFGSGHSMKLGGFTVALGGVLVGVDAAITGLHGRLLMDRGRPQVRISCVVVPVRGRLVRPSGPFERFARSHLRLLGCHNCHRQPMGQLFETSAQFVRAQPGPVSSRLS
jgi:hypothetical protein